MIAASSSKRDLPTSSHGSGEVSLFFYVPRSDRLLTLLGGSARLYDVSTKHLSVAGDFYLKKRALRFRVGNLERAQGV